MQNTLLDLTILALLLFLFGSVDRVVYDRRIRFWLLGWIAIFLHLLFHPHVWNQNPHRQFLFHSALHLVLLTIAGIAFLFSFIPRLSRAQTTVTAALFAIPATLLIVFSLAAPQVLWLMRLTILAGEAIAILEARRLISPSHAIARPAAQIAAPLAAAAMLAAVSAHPRLIPYVILAQLFFCAALCLRNTCGDETRGCLAAILGLFLWSLSLPLRAFLEESASPHTSVLWDLWDVPMFLTAFGMILVVLEENVHRATALSEDYRHLFDCHPLPMYLYNFDTLRFLRVNEAAVQHYGYSHEEWAAMTVMDIRPPSERAKLRRVLDGERRQVNVTQGWHHTLKNGRIIDVDIYRYSLQFENQPCNLITALDVTQRNATEQRLRQTYKLESLGQLTGGIAHDFNNLLAILMGSLELVDRENPEPRSRDLIQQAILSVRRGAALTRRLLAFSRQQPAEARPIAIPALVDSMAGFLKTSVGTAITLDIAFEPGLWQAAIDPNQLENAILNLTLNARDAMPHGGSLRIAAANVSVPHNRGGPFGDINAADYVLLTITDTGGGMPPEVLLRATEPFFTTKAPGEGTGLGLSMVQSFLQQAGGSLQIESHPGVGTTLQLYLPRAAEEVLPQVPHVIANEPIPRGDGTILLVEDEPTIRHVLGILLRRLGYTVLEASDGHAALALIQNTPEIALLLTDVILPRGMDGATLATEARALQPKLKVLFSSGYTRDVLLRDSRIPPDAHLLTKPYQIADLAQKLHCVLAAQPLEPATAQA